MTAPAAPNPFAGARTRSDVARLLSSSVHQLNYLLHARNESLRYTSFALNKRRGGTRSILAPRFDLKILQRRLAALLDLVYRPRQVVHGFVAERSIVTNAGQHVGSRFLLNVDLKDFFPSINFGRVRGLFMGPRVSAGNEAATVLAQLCCHRDALPQGSPTSPVVSNMICSRMDGQLLELAKTHNCRYTRYVDDLTFSKRSGSFPLEIGYNDENGRAILGKDLRAAIEDNGFTPHTEKTWLFDNTHRQTVTGLVVNKKPNVRRRFVRQIEAMIHAWKVHGLEKAQAVYDSNYWRPQPGKVKPPPFQAVVRGKIEFVKMVKGFRDPVYRRLQGLLVEVDESYISVMEQENALMDHRDVFISHAHEDKESVAKPLADLLLKAGLTVWFDEYEITIGDSIREKIDAGLYASSFGVVIMSKHYFAKRKTWTKREYDALVAGEDVTKQRRIFPIWHELTRDEVYRKSPILVTLKAEGTSKTPLGGIAEKIVKKVKAAANPE